MFFVKLHCLRQSYENEVFFTPTLLNRYALLKAVSKPRKLVIGAQKSSLLWQCVTMVLASESWTMNLFAIFETVAPLSKSWFGQVLCQMRSCYLLASAASVTPQQVRASAATQFARFQPMPNTDRFASAAAAPKVPEARRSIALVSSPVTPDL